MLIILLDVKLEWFLLKFCLNSYVGDFEDEKTPDGTLVETLMNHDIKYYGDDSCVETLNFMYGHC